MVNVSTAQIHTEQETEERKEGKKISGSKNRLQLLLFNGWLDTKNAIIILLVFVPLRFDSCNYLVNISPKYLLGRLQNNYPE